MNTLPNPQLTPAAPSEWACLVALMGVSQAELARATGVSQSSFSRYVSGDVVPKQAMGEALLGMAERRLAYYNTCVERLRAGVAATRQEGIPDPLTAQLDLFKNP